MWSATILSAPDEAVFAYPYTDLEGELRDRAWRFLMPAHHRSWFDAQLARLVRSGALRRNGHPADRTAYYRALIGERFRSAASRFRRIGEDAEADARLIAPFVGVALRVVAADAARLRSLAVVEDFTSDQVVRGTARVAENACLVTWVRIAVAARLESYRYALEHAFLAMPQDEAIDAERAIASLAVHQSALDTPPIAWREGACFIPALDRGLTPDVPLIAKG
jgi:hypothetical protein